MYKNVILAGMPESSHRDVFNVIPSLALDSSIYAGITTIWLEPYIPSDFLLLTYYPLQVKAANNN
jgi:hypothetical protein